MKLGVRLNKWLSSLKDWEKVVQKMKKVGTAIKKRGGNFYSRVRMVNIYLTPCMEYLVRFKLILKSITSLMWKSICSALGAYAITKTSVLTLCYPLWTQILNYITLLFLIELFSPLVHQWRAIIRILSPLKPCGRMLSLQPKAFLPKLCLARPLVLHIPICFKWFQLKSKTCMWGKEELSMWCTTWFMQLNLSLRRIYLNS